MSFWEEKRVLITGISGFVGPYLAEELIKRGAMVFGIVRPRASATISKSIRDRTLQDGFQLLEGDICNVYSVIKIIEIVKPDVVFHLAAQSYVEESFNDPLLFTQTNCIGTANLLEAVRLRCPKATVVFAGSSEEYGLVFSNQKQYEVNKAKYKTIFSEPVSIPELPVKETNPLRPLSPYAVSKIYAEYLMREYYCSFGLRTIVSRAFNHEGAGRGHRFVTSVITKQAVQLKHGEIDEITIGDVNSFRDWSHVTDIIKGYLLLAEKGRYGDVYIQGSMRTNSVLTYLLLSLEDVGYVVKKIVTINGGKVIEDPIKMRKMKMFGVEFEASKVDKLMLQNELYFSLDDEGLLVDTDKGKINVIFSKKRFRPSDVPILLSDPSKIMALGFKKNYSLRDIIRNQINYFMVSENRNISMGD